MTAASGSLERLWPAGGARRTVLGNTALQTGGYAAGLALTAATAALYTRYLGTAGFGTLSVIVVVFALAGSILNGSLETFAVRAFSAADRVDALLFRSLVGVKVSAATALCAVTLAGTFFLGVDGTTRLAVLAFGLVAIATSVQGAVLAASQSRSRFGLVVGSDLATRTLALVGAAAVFVAPRPVHAADRVALLAALAAATAAVVLTATLVRGRRAGLPLGIAFDRRTWRLLAREPLGLAAISLLGLLNYRVDVLVLAALKPARDVGLYGLATRIVEVALPLAAAFVGASFPFLSRDAATAPERVAAHVRRGVRLLVLAAVPLAVALELAAPLVVRTLAGPAYAGAVLPVRILALSLPFSFVSTFLLFALIAGGLQRRVLPLVAASLALNVVLNVALVPELSTTAPALATLVTEVLGAACLAVIARRALLRTGGSR